MRRFALLPALVLGLTLLATAAHAHAACRADAVDLRGDWGQARFAVEVVDTVELRARGLMGREALPASAGMLFIYDTPQRVSFWMRNTLIALDMLFIDATGEVIRIHHDAQPHDETPIHSGGEVVMVLEINGGLAARLGVGAGSVLRHPRIDPEQAAWPCDPD